MNDLPGQPEGPSILDRIATLVTERRWLVLGVLAVALALAGLQIPKTQANFSPQSLFATADREQDLTDAFKATFGNTESVLLVLVESDDVLSADSLRFIHSASLWLEERPWARRLESVTVSAFPRGGETGTIIVDPIIRGDTVTDAQAADLRRTLEQSRFLDGRVVSESRRVAAIAVFLGNDYVQISPIRQLVRETQDWIDANPPPAGATASVAGIPQVRAYVVNQMFRDQLTLVPLSLLVSVFLLFLCFRWLPAMIVPNIAVVVTITFVVGLMAAVGEPFNMVNQMLPILVLVIGINDSVHLVNRYGEELRAHGGRRLPAARATIRTMAAACALTSFTTAVGFGTLVVARTEILRSFGVSAAIAMLIAYVVTVMVVPALLMMFARPPQERFVSHDGVLERITVTVASRMMLRARVVVALTVVISALATWQATRVTVDSNLMELFRPGDPTSRLIHTIEDELNGIVPIELSLTSDSDGRFEDHELLNAVDRIAAWAEQQDGVLETTSWSTFLHEAFVAWTGDEARRDQPFRSRAQVAQLNSLLEGATPDPTTAYVTFDRRHLRLNIQIRDIGGVATLEFAERLQGVISAELADFEDISYHLTGDGYSAARGVDFIMRDMLSSVALAFVIIFFLMTFLFRSLRMGLISVPPNVIPLLVTLAWMSWRGILLNSTTAIIFSVSLGLAVDDTIHFLARFREELQAGARRDEAILRAARGTGRAILVTSVMLVGGMSVLFGSSFIPIALFAELIAVTVVGCILGDLFVLPALLRLFWPDGRGYAPDLGATADAPAAAPATPAVAP